MSIAMLLKIFSDCCICFAILGAFPAAFPSSSPLLFPALVCGAAAGLATFVSNRGKPRLSRACAVPVLFSLMFAGSFSELLILFPVVIYTIAVILRGQLQLEYYSYRQFFLRSLMLLGGLYVVLSAFSVLESIGGEEARLIHAQVTLRYGVVHLICGIILQRQLRLGAENRAQGGIGQMAAMLGGTGSVIFGFLLAEPALRRGATAVFKGILSVLLGAVMGLLELFNKLLDEVELNTMQEQVNHLREDTPPALFSAVVGDAIQHSTQDADEPRSMWWVALVLIILLAAMLLMFLSFRKKSGEPHSTEISAKVDPGPAERKPPRRSNQARVRQLYQDFLRQEKKRGLSLKKDYTSEDILRRISSDTNGEAASRLREIYIQARYDDDCRISRQQLEEAKAALKKSRGGLNT